MVSNRPHVVLDLDPNNYMDARITVGFRRVAEARGWILEHRMRQQELLVAALDPKVRIWVRGGTAWTDQLRKLTCNAVVVAAGIDRTAEGVPSVEPDEEEIGRVAAEYLLGRGFRSFGIYGLRGHPFAQRRADSFARRLLAERVQLARWSGGSLLAAEKEHVDDLSPWLGAMPKPAAVFACCESWADVLMHGAVCEGVPIPEEVAVLSAGDDPTRFEAVSPPLSGVIVPWEVIGEQTALLAGRLLDDERRPAGPITILPVGVTTRRSTDVIATSDDDVAAALRFIQEHAAEPIGVPDILRAVPVRRATLQEKFRRVVGRTIMGEVHRAHIERAKRLLATTNMTVEQIAAASGYSCGQRLSKSFYQHTGQTCTQYRRAFRSPPRR